MLHIPKHACTQLRPKHSKPHSPAQPRSHLLLRVAKADEQHGEDVDDVGLKQAAQLLGQALKGAERACAW